MTIGWDDVLTATTPWENRGGRYHLRYGISPDPDDDSVIAFHKVGAAQAQQIPSNLRHLVIPCGSANSTISILLGLSLYPHSIEKITLIGIGPNRESLIADRLDLFREKLGVSLPSSLEVEMHDLHTSGLVSYGKRVPQTLDGMTFHPTYEGKVVNHLLSYPDVARGFTEGDSTTGLWIIGSEPKG